MMNQEKPLQELLEFSIINIDKPANPTSFDVSEFVMKKLKLRKTSHFGTLDPKVTGVLPIALNRACKLTGFFLGEDKEYVGVMRIHEEKDIKEIQKIINEKFLGVIKQLPPVKSRVKREIREREIKSFELLEVDESGKDILFKATVQGGTYIRKLLDDLGKEIGGAHMLELRRVRAGIFSETGNEKIKSPSVNLYDFEKAVDEYEKGNEKALREILIPGEEALKKIFPSFQVKEGPYLIKTLFTGKPLHKLDVEGKIDLEEDEKFILFNKDKFIGVYRKTRGENVGKPEFVMQEMRG